MARLLVLKSFIITLAISLHIAIDWIYYYTQLITDLVTIRGETKWINAILHIVFECIVILQCVTGFWCKETFHMGIWVLL